MIHKFKGPAAIRRAMRTAIKRNICAPHKSYGIENSEYFQRMGISDLPKKAMAAFAFQLSPTSVSNQTPVSSA
ncbi:hypothetical protein OEG84_02785 [Hoeflea sp. G2-23]|uniref:Uncharacterized protein n=1 Tax=Hoeflea algicola TaxID=2983763 RepID=A0ABT3Z4H1_9HYPH|nr:hypothetical protein [Hoeflea algicola]MCY0146668.1 hypothetical protein [Hoeflea algicola]